MFFECVFVSLTRPNQRATTSELKLSPKTFGLSDCFRSPLHSTLNFWAASLENVWVPLKVIVGRAIRESAHFQFWTGANIRKDTSIVPTKKYRHQWETFSRQTVNVVTQRRVAERKCILTGCFSKSILDPLMQNDTNGSEIDLSSFAHLPRSSLKLLRLTSRVYRQSRNLLADKFTWKFRF